MTRRAVSLLLVAAFAVLAGHPVGAQGTWTGRIRGGFNVGIQADTAGLSQSFTLTKNVEPAPIAAELAPAGVLLVDGGIVVRVAGNLGAGVSFSSSNHTADAEVTASIPHPFFFNRPRAITGVESVEHKEFATNVSGVYVVVSRRMDVGVSGGLSFFRVEKDFVTDVTFTESFPYDSATFVRAELNRERVSKTGFHLGADLTWKLGSSWGIGGLVRYSKASAPFSGGALDVGGLQAGGGIRVMY